MANIGTDLNAWSTTEASNQPDGTDSATIAGDLRAIQAGVRNAFGASDTIASATTCDLGSKSAGYLTISGTTTITSLGSTATAGLRKTVTFSGALTLTHHATNLILPTGANITTVAGDHAEFICTGSGTWTCLWYAGKTLNTLTANVGTLNVTGNTTLGDSSADTVTLYNLNGGQLAGFRNKVYNGACAVDQRGSASTAVTITGTGTVYSIDRFTHFATPTTCTAGRVAGDANSRYALRLTKPNTTSASGLILAAQAFETSDSIPLAGKTIVFSFRARVGSTYTGSATPRKQIYTGTGTDQSASAMIGGTWTGSAPPTLTTISNPNLSTTFQTYAFSATIGASVTQIGFDFGTTATAVAGSANDYIEFTDIQLEIGSVATPFEQRPIGVEIGLCQRYYCKSYHINTVPATITTNGVAGSLASGTSSVCYLVFPQEMRDTPNMTYYSAITGTSGFWRRNTGAADVAVANSVTPTTRNATCGTNVGTVTDTEFVYGHWVAEKEL